MNIIYFASICLIHQLATSLTTTPTFSITNKYIETGTFAVTTAGYLFGNTSWIGVQQVAFAFALQRPHTAAQRTVVFQQLNFLITPAYQLNVSIATCGSNSTSINTCITSNYLNNINTLRQRYILLDSGFSKVSFYSLFIYGTPGTLLNTSVPYQAAFGLPAANLNGTMRAFVAWIGINATAPNSNINLDLKATASFYSSTILLVTISTTVTGNIILGAAFLCYVGYNQQQVAAWPFPSGLLNYNTFSGINNAPAVYSDSNSLTRDYNTFWGFTRINFNNKPSIHFTSDLTVNTSIQGTSSTPFNDLELAVLIFQFKQCDSTTPYYMKFNDTCYDICPPRYYGSAQYLCISCVNYDCYQCSSNGTCTVCSNSTDYRVLNSSTNRCDAMTGYYDSGTNTSQAQPCNSNCKSCRTTAIYCTSCFDGFFVNSSNVCSPCYNNCQICTSNTTCTTCAQYYTNDNNTNSCVSIINCATIANCTTCNISSGCTTCTSGYNLTNMTNCAAVCGDGIKLPFQACDDNNTLNGDGCSSNCTIETAYFCTLNLATSICSNCSAHCSQCNSSISCQTCSSPYLLSNATFSCVPNCSLINLCITCHEPIGTNQTLCDSCSIGYEPVNNTCTVKCGDAILIFPEECDDGNTVNNDGCSSVCKYQSNAICSIMGTRSMCSFCPSKKYADVNHTTCLNCNYDCNSCNSVGCLTCSPLSHRTLNNSTHKCVADDGYYDDMINQAAAACSPDCLTCNGGNSSACLSCTTNKALMNNTCILCSLTSGIGCSTCTVNSSSSIVTCLSCSGSLQNGTCFTLPNPPDDMLAKMLLMILLPLLLTLCCCCLIIYCIWRRRRHQENKIDEENVDNNIEKSQEGAKIYKVESKKLDGKIENNDTEGNELSMNEFKQINELKVEVEVVKEKSEVNNAEFSQKSDFSKQSEEDQAANRGCHY